MSNLAAPTVQHQFCYHVSKDERICILYRDHFGPHKENHLKSEWSDDE